MNKSILLLIFLISLLSLYIINLNQLKVIEGEIDKISYKSFGIIIEIDNQEFIILENKILDLYEGDKIKMTYLEEEYNLEPENVIEKIVKI